MTAYIFDSETTGLNEPQLVEAAWLKVENISSLAVSAEFIQRYKPGKPIELSALATSHILDEELEGHAPHTDFQLPTDLVYMIGHNVDYDWRVVGEPEVKRICTKALSTMLWPSADSHSQSSMIYMHYRAEAKSLLQNAHAALDDVKNCRLLLVKILDALAEQLGRHVSGWEDLWEISENARIPTVIGFGKHKGMAIADLPSDYKRWFLNQADLDPFMRKALSR